MAERTVMVVEDDALIRELVLELLTVEGFEAVAARNGAEALESLRGGGARPALILLDLMMPVMNGWQFREEQLGDPALADIPVVVMSASDPAAVPADAVVPKPFPAAALLEVVARMTAGAAPAASGTITRSRPPGPACPPPAVGRSAPAGAGCR